jgi:predicted ester cyclase
MKSDSKMTRRKVIAASEGLTGAIVTGTASSVSGEDLDADKAVALGLSKAIMTGDWQKVDELLAPDFAYVGDGNPAIDKAGYIGFMRGVLTAAFTDMDMNFLHVIAEGGFVSVNYTNAMTHTENFIGIPATGKRVLASGQFIREIRDGKVVGEWQTTNAIGLMQALGAIPSRK